MVKAKKGGKKELIHDDVVDSDDGQTQVPDASDEEIVVKETSKKDKKKAKKVIAESESESDVEKITKSVKAVKVSKGKSKKKEQKGGFDLLMADDSDDDVVVQEPPTDDEEPEEVKPTAKQAAGKKGKKSKKKRNDSEEDIEKALAELELEYAGVKKPEIENPEPVKEDKKKSKSKVVVEDVVVDEEEQDEETGSSMKTAAQKKKEKKERQKREATQQKQQQIKAEASAEVAAPKVEKVKESKPKNEEESVIPKSEDAEDVDKKDDKKKKKKKVDKKEEEKEKEKTKKKGISSAVVAAMQERLQKVKEEEERLKKEEDERIRLEEEREDQRLENLRLEAERKEKKKLREHERKARLKAEGKLLTAKQKQDKARAQGMLDSLRAQGVDLPEVGEKRPRAGTRVRVNKKKDQPQEDPSAKEAVDESTKVVETVVETVVEEEVEKVKDAWDASSSEDESEELPAKDEKKAESDEESGSDESDDDDDDDDDEDDSDDSDDSEEDHRTDAQIKREKALARIRKRRHAAEQKCTIDNLRAAVVCVLGHVDTGKTKILDKLRRTNVQDCEAGGITQQIGATNVPIEAIKEQTRIVRGFADMQFRLPGLLIIDTPGHESFKNLRNRGSSLCDIAILVVDIMHGLEPQTIESINILRSKNCPFVVALNKIDRLYDWKTVIRKDIRDVLKSQADNTQMEFQQRTKDVILQFAENGLNAALFYENPDPRSYVNLIPTSAITGEGMGNLLHLIVESCQSWLAKRLMYSEELLCTVMEVKAIPGLGTTIDAILINGKLREGETVVIAGTDGPIVTQIRSLLMPQPMKELRVKNAYTEYKEIVAAQGVKLAAKDLEKAIAGLNLYVANKPDEVDICREVVANELKSALSHIKLKSEGVYVQASTLGSLEALLEFLGTSKIPYANIRIGPVVKRDVMKASTMLEHESQFATILAFDVKVEKDAQDYADTLGVKIFQADIIYHLFDKFTAYREEIKRKKREEFSSIAVFPCKLKILPQFIFNSRDPIVMGVMIEAGIIKEGTPICVPGKEFLDIGIVTSVECNHKQVETARKGQEVCIKIEPIPGESPKMYGRHFDENDILTSKISRQSIDACKDYFRDDLEKSDWTLMIELKKLFEIL